MKAELVNLRASLVSGGPAAASQGAGGKLGGFIPWKSMTPKTCGSKGEQWREWCEEVRDYFDVVKPGMKQLLTAAEKETDHIVDSSWAKAKGEDLGNESVQLWRALKKLTEDYSDSCPFR